MKRSVVLFFVLTFLSMSVYAQDVSGGFTHINRTYIEKQKKVYDKFDAKTGLTHIVEFNPKLYIDAASPHIGLSYIAGWRFNNLFLAGIGTGLDFAAFFVSPEVKKAFKDSQSVVYFETIDGNNIRGALNAVSIPLYAHARFYFMRTRWSPYASVSLGGRLAPKDCGVYFDFSAGVSYLPPQSFIDKYKITGVFATFGLCLTQQNDLSDFSSIYYGFGGDCGDSNCPYRGSGGHEHYEDIRLRRHTGVGPSIRIGVTF